MTYYADTSWWLSLLYASDRNHWRASGLFERDPAAVVLWTPWQWVEVFNSLRRMAREGTIERSDAHSMIRRTEANVRAGLWKSASFDLEKAVARADALSKRLSQTLPIRGMDLFHVAVAMTVRAEAFLSFDAEQLRFARAAGLKLDPGSGVL